MTKSNRLRVHPGILLGLFALLNASGETAGTRELTWKDLQPRIEIENPFDALSREQLTHLQLVLKVRALRKREGKDNLSASLRKRTDAAERALRKEAIDIDALEAAREKIMSAREKKNGEPNGALKDQPVRIAGHLLPLEFEGKKTTEFLLVPWVGACIHTPPPPPNQIVHVRLEKPYASTELYESVVVSGSLRVGAIQKNLFLVDGSADIDMLYSMPSGSVQRMSRE
ncbi:MAG: DUF3299 domain-containing protein [Verrucomicrobiota bacterium]